MKKITAMFQNVISSSAGPAPPPPPTVDDNKNKKYAIISAQLDRMSSRNRYITFISTDKPIYRPGDTVHFRAWPLHAHTFEPLLRPVANKLCPSNPSFPSKRGVRWEVISPSDAVVVRIDDVGVPDWGTVSDSWEIPAGLAGGNYKLRVVYDIEGFAPAEREFNIREFSNPRFKMQLEFVKKGLGPGDEATANLSAVKADGSVIKEGKVEAVARVDGAEVHRSQHKLDDHGNLQIKFRLPANIARGDGTLSCAINDGASVENCSKTIPIVMQTIDVRAYAEGGEFVAGLKCGLYIEAFLINGDPADLTAEILDDRNIAVGNIQTQHEGRGRSAFTPEAGRSYKLRVLAPSGIKNTIPLPAVLNEGVTVSALQNTFTASESVRVRVAATKPAAYRVGLFKKDLEVSTSFADIDRPNGEREIAFTLPATSVADGVLRITVFGPDGNPVAERLTFRKPAGKVNVVVQPNKKRYSPGEKCTLKIRAYDAATQEPIGALIGVCVTDDSVLEMVEKRKQAPRLPVQAYFESEVDHLDDAHVYLDPTNPTADAAIDLLLGTQGWRRFAFVDVVKYMELAELKTPVPNVDLTYNRMGPKLTSTIVDGDKAKVVCDVDTDQLYQAAHPLPRNSPIQYFEITVEAAPAADPVIAVGFTHDRYAKTGKLPGWEADSVAVHSDDGCFFKDGAQIQRNWLFGVKDTVGMGFNEISKQVFFTKNGELKGICGSISNSDVLQYLLTVGMRGKGTAITVNANGPFKFTPSSVFAIAKPKNTDAAERLLAAHHHTEDAAPPSPVLPPQPVMYSPADNDNIELSVDDYVEGAGMDEEREAEPMRTSAVSLSSMAVKRESNKDNMKEKMQQASPRAPAPLRGGAPPVAKSAPPTAAKGAPPLSPSRGAAPPRPSAAPPAPSASAPPPASPSKKLAEAPILSRSSSVASKEKKMSRRASLEEEDAASSRRRLAKPIQPRPVAPARKVVREYVHLYRPASNPLERVDFKETLYWNGSLMTHPFTDHVISFDLSDSITSFKVIVDAVSRHGGLLGSAVEVLPSTEPFYIEFKLPIECSAGDKVQIPVSLNNDTNRELKVKLKAGTTTPALSLVSVKASKKSKELRKLLIDGRSTTAVPSNGNKRVFVHAAIAQAFVNASLTLNAFADSHRDLITRGMRIVPAGFPFKLSASGALKTNTDKSHSFSIPMKTEPTSIAVSLKFYLNPLGSMTQALKALVREPYGCFEQTSSVAYPLVMAQQYFLTHRGVDPALIASAKTNLQKSYDRLKGFEVKTAGVIPTGGFDWYGSAPANESLTAYGLLEFQDMKEVYPVEEALIERIKKWLISRRDGKGQFLRGSGRYGFGNAPQDVTNAYICWAISERNGPIDQLAKEIEFILPLCGSAKSSDPYYLGLCALTLFNANRTADAHKIAQRLVALQDTKTGVVNGGNNPKLHDSRFTSITYSYGDGLLIEATSFAILVWLRGGEPYMAPLEAAMKWLATRCKDGAFGSTQSTIMALKAIVEYDKLRSNSDPGAVTILLDGKQIAEIEVNDKSPAVLDGPDLAPFLREKGGGAHELKVKLEGGNALTYSIAIDYNALQPDDDPECAVRLATQLSKPELPEGEQAEVRVSITNTDATVGQPMVVAIVGLPGGLEPRHEQLREHVKAGRIDFYEVLGREVILYLREMGPAQRVEVPIDVIAKIPGVYQGPASRTYLYYTNESKHWNAPLQVTVVPSANTN